jgi:hypothetical protein
MEQRTLTFEEQEANRRERLAEVGTMPPCPFCQRPRVERSDYLRCNPCGINWLLDERNLRDYLNRNPSACRDEARKASMPIAMKPSGSAE